MWIIFQLFKNLKFKRKRGSPILEEILLIGIAIVIFAIIFGLILGLIDWTTVSIEDLFG